MSRGPPEEPGWAVLSLLSLHKSGGLGVPQPAKGATLRLQLPCRLCPALKKGACAPGGARGGLRAPSPPLPLLTPPKFSSRLQLRPDGAAGGGRGGPAAPRRLRGALPPAAAAGFGEPQQAAVSGDPLRPPPPTRSPPRWGDAPRTYANKGCRDGAGEWRCWGDPALAPHSRGAQIGPPPKTGPPPLHLNGAAPLRGAGLEKGAEPQGRWGPFGGVAPTRPGGVAYF